MKYNSLRLAEKGKESGSQREIFINEIIYFTQNQIIPKIINPWSILNSGWKRSLAKLTLKVPLKLSGVSWIASELIQGKVSEENLYFSKL